MQNNTIKQITYDYLLEQASVLFLALDRTGKIIEANEYAAELVGEDIRGKTAQDVFVDFSMSFDLTELSRDSTQTHLLNVNTFTRLPQTFYFNFFDLGHLILAFGKLDIIEIEMLRKQLVTANNELNNLTRELQKKNAELARLNQLKNQFLGIAAHDLRNPTAIISTYSEFLLDETRAVLSAEHLKLLATIQSTSKFMQHLIDSFLDIAVIESGEFELGVQPIDLLLLINKCLTLNNMRARKSQVNLLLDHDEDIPTLLLDGPKIEQVVNNLLSNAIEYSAPHTTVKVTVSRSRQTVVVSVQDEGLGIPPDEVDRLFKPFGRTSVRKPAGQKSTGLGLVISRKIIEAHHGAIGVESEAGKGSTFYFSLPINCFEEELSSLVFPNWKAKKG